MIRDVAAQNASLDHDYGSGSPASHTFHLFAGDPAIPAADGGGVELVAGYTPPTITNDATNWPAAANGQKVGPLVSVTSTAALADVATHWALKGSDGNWWDTGALEVEWDINAAGVTKTGRLVIFYADRGQ